MHYTNLYYMHITSHRELGSCVQEAADNDMLTVTSGNACQYDSTFLSSYLCINLLPFSLPSFTYVGIPLVQRLYQVLHHRLRQDATNTK